MGARNVAIRPAEPLEHGRKPGGGKAQLHTIKKLEDVQ